MRTPDEIIGRIERSWIWDMASVTVKDLGRFLEWRHARHYLQPHITEEIWRPVPQEREIILEGMLEYMPFAFEKAQARHGRSAHRSLVHFSNWIWLLGDEEHFQEPDVDHFGLNHLKRICEHYGWGWHQWDSTEKNQDSFSV